MTATRPLPDDKKGLAEITIGGKTTTLHSTFENMSAFESVAKIGLYALIHRFTTNDVRLTDIVHVIWCFSLDRDTEGWTKEDISRALMQSQPAEVIVVVKSFLMLMFGLTQAEEVAEEATGSKKKTVRQPKAK